MATRKKKPSKLGSTWKVHQVQMRNAEGRMTLRPFEWFMDEGDCTNALAEIYNLGVDVGYVESNLKAMGRKSEAHDDAVLHAAVKKADQARERFRFQCVVGGFAGLKPQRRK